jgi:hypothetical protein|tara:strand:- start:436 stop:654 length:219 start_codon:yes stop_codon:yes gene_type:complete
MRRGDAEVGVAFNESVCKHEMLEWLLVKIDELLAISMRIAVALEGLTHETRLQRLLIAETVDATEVVIIEET